MFVYTFSVAMEKEENNSYINLRPRKVKKGQMSSLNLKDNTEDSPVFYTDKPSSRRVSFASSNFVKKFAIDPERNTIWDSTYEEMINSDSTQSSENAHGTLNVQQTRINSVLQCESKVESTNTSINFNVQGGEDIECDLTLFEGGIANNENGNARVQNTSDMKKNPLSNHNQNRTIFNEVGMEITEHTNAINETNCERLTNRTSTTEILMDCTEFLANTPSPLNLNTTFTNNDSLEYTCQIPIMNIQTPYAEVNGAVAECTSMDLTRAIVSNKLVPQESNATILTHVNMEQTMSVENKLILEKRLQENEILLHEKNSKNESQSTDPGSVEMDLTTPITMIDRNESYLKEVVQNNTNKTACYNTLIKNDWSELYNEKIDQISCKKNNILNETTTKRVLRNKTILKTSKHKENNTTSQLDEQTTDASQNSCNEIEQSKLNTKVQFSFITQENDSAKRTSVSPSSFHNSDDNNSHILFEGTEQLHKDKQVGPKNASYTNCLSLSLCADDTQQLINYNLSNGQGKSDFSKIITGDLNPSFINSKIVALSSFNSDGFPVSLENTQELKENNKIVGLQSTYLISNNIDEVNWKEGRSLEEIPSEKNVCLESSEFEQELHISQESIVLSDSILSNDSSSSIHMNVHDIIAGITIPKASLSTGQLLKNKDIWQDYLKSNQSVECSIIEFNNKSANNLENAKSITRDLKEQCTDEVQVISQSLKPCSIEENESDSDCSDSSSFNNQTKFGNGTQDCYEFETDELSLTLEKTLTLEEQIEKKYKRSQNYLKIIEVKDGVCKTSTMFNTIGIDIYFTKDKGTVQKLDIHNTISNDSESIALLLHKTFVERLKEKNVQSAIGEKYDILSLLDYIHLNMQKNFDVLQQYTNFEIEYNCKMDKTFMSKFYIITLRSTWCISVDVSDLDNISENSIMLSAEVGTINEHEIKKFLNKSSKGLTFLRNFLRDVKTYSRCVMQKQT